MIQSIGSDKRRHLLACFFRMGIRLTGKVRFVGVIRGSKAIFVGSGDTKESGFPPTPITIVSDLKDVLILPWI